MMSLREGRFNGQFASFRHVTSGETNGRHHITHRNVDSCDWNDIATPSRRHNRTALRPTPTQANTTIGGRRTNCVTSKPTVQSEWPLPSWPASANYRLFSSLVDRTDQLSSYATSSRVASRDTPRRLHAVVVRKSLDKYATTGDIHERLRCEFQRTCYSCWPWVAYFASARSSDFTRNYKRKDC